MKILNYLRIKFHPLRYLKSFNSIRNILNKLDFIYCKKSKKLIDHEASNFLFFNKQKFKSNVNN